MKKTAVIVMALCMAGMIPNALACATCGCSDAKASDAATSVKKACGAGCSKPCCAATQKASCSADKKSCGATAAKACCGTCKKADDKHAYQTVDTDGLKKMIASGEKMTIVDARSGKWDDGRRIGSATQLGAGSSDEEIAKALPNKDAKIVAYCTSTKCPASAKLAHKLVHLGYKNVVKYPDGVDGWQKAGNDVKMVK